jgi:hypothetical protein
MRIKNLILYGRRVCVLDFLCAICSRVIQVDWFVCVHESKYGGVG